MTPDTPIQQPSGYNDMLRGIQELGVAQYTPVVESIIATRSRDAHHIQHPLDHLLDFACHPAGLALYKTLTGRIRQLAERYATPLPQLTDEVATLAARVDGHLKKMGAVWK